MSCPRANTIYEYFLTQFADQKAHYGGEFFTPVSLVSLIANVIEPERGIVFDPACGSGGMFVQSARFVERLHQNPANKLTFFGLEKNATTIAQLKQVRYFWRQAHWLTERFPEAKLRDVEGLGKLVDIAEIEANDWSLTPGRYVGVAPEEEDEDFDFEEVLGVRFISPLAKKIVVEEQLEFQTGSPTQLPTQSSGF